MEWIRCFIREWIMRHSSQVKVVSLDVNVAGVWPLLTSCWRVWAQQQREAAPQREQTAAGRRTMKSGQCCHSPPQTTRHKEQMHINSDGQHDHTVNVHTVSLQDSQNNEEKTCKQSSRPVVDNRGILRANHYLLPSELLRYSLPVKCLDTLHSSIWQSVFHIFIY